MIGDIVINLIESVIRWNIETYSLLYYGSYTKERSAIE